MKVSNSFQIYFDSEISIYLIEAFSGPLLAVPNLTAGSWWLFLAHSCP